MDLQFVFGNPTTKKKKTKKSKTGGKMAKKKVTKKAAKKTAKKATKKAAKKSTKKAASKPAKKSTKRTTKKAVKAKARKARKATKRTKKSSTSKPRFKQRIDFTSKLGRMSHTVKWPRRSTVLKAQANIAELEEVARQTKNRKSKKKLRSAALKKKMALYTEVNKANDIKRSIKNDIKEAKAAGVVVKRTKPVLSNPKKTKKRKHVARKHRSKVKTKRNPIMGGSMGKFESYTGHSVNEAGALALGGALFGTVNGVMAKFAAPVHGALTKVPVVGTSLPTLLIGALLNYFGEKRNIKALSLVGKGLVGASVVGMGVQAGQLVAGKAGLAGIDYTMDGYGQDDADFGEYADMGNEADFGAIDYTMDGVDYTMDGYGEDDADFGMDAQMGELPQGMA